DADRRRGARSRAPGRGGRRRPLPDQALLAAGAALACGLAGGGRIEHPGAPLRQRDRPLLPVTALTTWLTGARTGAGRGAVTCSTVLPTWLSGDGAGAGGGEGEPGAPPGAGEGDGPPPPADGPPPPEPPSRPGPGLVPPPL